MILFKRLWESRQERPVPRDCQDGSWVFVAVTLLIICLLWMLWMRDWAAAGYPTLPKHPQTEGRSCCE